jgi:hypothetical protein
MTLLLNERRFNLRRLGEREKALEGRAADG